MLVGNLSQYFCEKNSLEKELSILRNSNNTEEINSKEEEIHMITRNAYLYAVGITLIAFIIAIEHAWGFFLAETLGMKHRILFTAVIYEKAKNISFCMCACKYLLYNPLYII